jgi:hypothetical protein
MPEQRVVTETYWCPGPWPWQWARTCIREVTKWCYDFSFLNVSYRFFYTDYLGCEYNVRYSWRSRIPPFRIEDFTLYFYTRCFNNRLPEQGACVPSPDVGVNFIGRTLENFIEAKVKEVLQRGEPQQ